MKNTRHARPLARIAATTAITALATTGLAMPAANALLSDNVHNVAGIGVLAFALIGAGVFLATRRKNKA